MIQSNYAPIIRKLENSYLILLFAYSKIDSVVQSYNFIFYGISNNYFMIEFYNNFYNIL